MTKMTGCCGNNNLNRSNALVLSFALLVVVHVSLSSSWQVHAFSTSAPHQSLQKSSSFTTKGRGIVFDRHYPHHPTSNNGNKLTNQPPYYSPETTRNNRTTNNNHRRHLETTVALQSILDPTVLTASISATAKLLSSIGIGALATPKGPKFLGRVLDGNSISALSKLTYWMFQPAFLLCGVATTLAKASTSPAGATAVGIPKSALLLLPIASLMQIGLGSIAAKLLTTKRFGVRPKLLGIEPEDEDGANDIKMCTTFSNAGPLPLILSDALFGGAILSDVTSCVSFYLLLWSPLFWSFGRIILGTYVEEKGENDSIVDKVVSKAKIFLSPPVVGSILGVVIGSNSFLRNAMLMPGGILTPLFGAAKTFGVAYLPAAVLVLAGSLAGAKKSEPVDAGESSSFSSSLSPKTVIAIILSRFILSPVLALTTVRLLSVLNLLPADNPRALAIVTFTLLMEGCMPPAQNSVILLQLDNKKERAAKMAKMLTVIYALSVVPITLLLSGCLSLSGIVSYL